MKKTNIYFNEEFYKFKIHVICPYCKRGYFIITELKDENFNTVLISDKTTCIKCKKIFNISYRVNLTAEVSEYI